MKLDKFYLDDGTYIRFKKIGKGAPILLLHTFRNRLEYSDKLGKLLEKKFTVYSIDLPGFGDSPINTNTKYDLNFFTESVVNFINKLKLKNLTIAGESIGATIAASVSVEIPKIVKKMGAFWARFSDSPSNSASIPLFFSSNGALGAKNPNFARIL